MKKYVCITFALLYMLFAASCSLKIDLPDTVEIESKSYTRTFSNILYPMGDVDLLYPVKINRVTYHRIDNVPYDCYICYDVYGCPNLYFEDSISDEAVSYYQNPENYNYYYIEGNIFENPEYQINDIDFKMFDELIEFAEENAYNPLTSFNNNENVKNTQISDYDSLAKSELHIFKVSKDEAFSTMQGYSFLILKDKPVFVYYYDFKNGEGTSELMYVDLPVELSDYFCALFGDMLK